MIGAVSNIKNKFEEFSGLRYEPEDDDSDSISDSSPLSSNALHFDLNVHIKQILKRQLLSQTKVSKKRIKLPKFTLDTKREISGLPNKLLSGLKSTTARTFEEIAQKSKKWEKGVRHFVGRNSDSESLGVYSDMYLDSNDVYLSTEDEINTPIIKRTKNDFNSESGIQAHQSGTSYSRSECEVYVSSQENESGDMANYSERDSKLYSPMIQPVNIHVEVSEYDSMDEKMSLITGQIDALYIEMQVFDRIDDALDKQIETLTRMLNEKNESVQEFGRRVEEVDKKRGILENRGFEDDVEKTEYSLEMVQEKTTEFESDVRQIIDKVKKVGC